jgi:hypothetical protein
MAKHMVARPINFNLRDPTKPHVSSQKGNHSQDDIDVDGLDTFLEEIAISSSHRDVVFANHDGRKAAREDYYKTTSLKNSVQADKSVIKSLNSKPSFDDLGVKTKESKLDVRATASLNKFNQNKEALTQAQLNLQTTIDVANSVRSNPNTPPQSQVKSKPTLTELITKSTPKAQVPTFLSAPVNETTKPHAAPEKTSLSLADLAKQHKSQRSKVASSKESLSRKINEDMSNLPCMEAQGSTSTKCHPIINSSCPSSFFHCLDNKTPNKLNGKTNPSLFTNLLDDLSKTQAGNQPSISSLSNLVRQHKHLTQSLSSFPPQQTASLTPDLMNIKFKETELSQKSKSKIPSVVPPSPNLHSKASVPDISLTSCLKSSKPSITGNIHALQAQHESDTEESPVIDNQSYMDIVQDLSCLNLQENSTHTDLMAPASDLGFVLCSFKWKGTPENARSIINRPLRYPKFKCSTQVRGREMYPENVYHKIEPFDFSSPSPDDIVKSKQKQAFTRPDKEFEL